MVKAVFLGPPGAGKGTQAVKIAQQVSARHLSTGDMLRAAVKAGTPLGQEAKGFMAAGKLVPDSLIVGLIREVLAGGVDSFILDGFPRTLPQAEALDEMLAAAKLPLGEVVLFTVADQVLVQRLSGRISCPGCSSVYHVVSNPPAKAGICDKCGDTLQVRLDDREDVVRNRLRVYAEQTAPLIEYYRQQGILKEVDAARPVDVVYQSVENLFETA